MQMLRLLTPTAWRVQERRKTVSNGMRFYLSCGHVNKQSVELLQVSRHWDMPSSADDKLWGKPLALAISGIAKVILALAGWCLSFKVYSGGKTKISLDPD